MDLLLDLLGVKAPPGTTLDSVELTFRPPLPLWVLVTLAVVLVASAVVVYLREPGRLPFRRVLLITLRSTFYLLILALLCVHLVAQGVGTRPHPVLLVLDNSQSMKQQDRRLSDVDLMRVAIAKNLLASGPAAKGEGELKAVRDRLPKDPSRADLVRAVLANPQLDLIDGLRKSGPLRPYLFAREVPVPPKGDPKKSDKDRLLEPLLAGFDAHEPKTPLADSINQLLRNKAGGKPVAVVVMTDGRDNASKLSLEDAARECARAGVPLHIYGVGSSEAGSLQIKDVVVADTLFFDDVVGVPIRYRAQGFKSGTVQLKLTLGDKVVAEREVPVRSGEELREVLTFTPTKDKEREQKLDLKASVRLKEKPTFQDSLSKRVRLLDSKVKVLYVENTPRWEFKFLQPALLRDRRVEAKFILVAADPETVRPPASLRPEERERWPYLQAFPSREELRKYDLVILGDVPTGPKGFLKPEHLVALREFVEEQRGGLAVIAGRNFMPAAYAGTPLAEILPVEFQPVKFTDSTERRTEPYRPVLTKAGRRAEMLSLADAPEESLKVWRDLPGFYWHYPVTRLKPGATSLLDHPRAKAGEQPMPLMAVHHFGRGEVLFLASDETWRWRYNAQDKHFGRFWGQAIYQMGLPHLLGDHSSRVQMALERSEALLGRPGLLYARLYDKDFRGLKEKQVTAKLHYLDAKPGEPKVKTIQLERVEGRDGEYRALLPHDRPGRYEVKLETPEPATFSFRVNVPPEHELEESGLNEEALREAARLSGGDFYREEDLYRLPGAIRPRTESYLQHDEVPPWNWLTFAALVLLLTTEWVVRKFSNLS
jgi:hypothetical protein